MGHLLRFLFKRHDVPKNDSHGLDDTGSPLMKSLFRLSNYHVTTKPENLQGLA